MNISKYLRNITLVMLGLTVLSLQAGSYFNSKGRGLGMRQYATGARGIGMGYTGIAANDSLQLNSYSVTQWRQINNTRATIGISYQSISTDLPASSFRSATADFSGLTIAVPVVKKKWVFGVAVIPYTDLDFKSTQQLVSAGQTFTQTNIYRGSITKAQFSLVWSPSATLGIGVNGSYFIGRLSDEYGFEFESNNLRETVHTVHYRFKGPAIGFNADYQPSPRFRLAGFVDFPAKPNLKVEYESPVADVTDRERTFDQFPLHFGLGTAIQLTPRLQMMVDYTRQSWSDVLASPNSDFDDWSIFGVGVERAASRSRNAGFFSKMDLRGGFSARKLGYKFNGESVSELAGHVGLGIPFGFNTNRIDIALTAGLRGDLNKNGAEEKFLRLDTAISVGEFWFQKLR